MSSDPKKSKETGDDDDYEPYEEVDYGGDGEDDEDVNVEEEDKPKADDGKESSDQRGSYVGIHSSGFRDFLVKPELLRAIGDCGFEHPSEVQQECIPQAVLGMDMICQAKSGMGKTAVFVIAVLNQLEPDTDFVDTLVLVHTRELAYQITQEFERFSKYLPTVNVACMFGGLPEQTHIDLIKKEPIHIVIGTPGRIKSLIQGKHLKVDKLKRFVLDECDRVLESLDMRRDIQTIFKMTPHEKQVMMFSATISADIRKVCNKFSRNPMEIFVDNKELTLHGLQQYYVKLSETEKTRRLCDLLDALDFNQVVIFVKSVARAKALNSVLKKSQFPSVAIHRGVKQTERLKIYNDFKQYKCRILVATDLFGRGVDFERVNIVVNYDMPDSTEMYLHRVGRSGRFGTKGLAVTFLSKPEEIKGLSAVQERFEVKVQDLPDKIDSTTYMMS